VLQTFSDGRTRSQLYVGALIYRFRNVESGAQVERNLGGDGLVQFADDGSFSWTYLGPAAVAFFPGDPLAAGLWVLDGYHVIDYSADGSHRDLKVRLGTEENLCDTLR
jgi:hypothetical protein